MIIFTKRIAVISLLISLVACSGGKPNGPEGKSGAAASACDAFVKTKLEGKQYTLDLYALAASFNEGAERSGNMSAAIIIEPGLTTEVKQTLKCDLRFAADDTPEVLQVSFIW